MGLTDAQKGLIQALSSNNMQAAKKWAIACIGEDNTAKNKGFCGKYKSILESSNCNMVELPRDLKEILCVEDVSLSFKPGRYYLPDRERDVFQSIERMKKVSEKLVEMGIPCLNATLLFGESGTGKTTFGRYVAYKLGLPFCYLNFSRLVDSYMGNTSKNISKAFSYAVSNPCVFMLDEIDCISIRRSDVASGGTDGEMARVTITLMQEFDRLPNDTIVIGATNREDRMDEALLRRFPVTHKFQSLHQEERVKMIQRYIRDVGMELTDEEISALAEDERSQAFIISNLIRLIAKKSKGK